jgi:hypothetical protein
MLTDLKNVKRVSLVYFGGCPNYQTVRQMLIEIGLPFKEINQDNLQAGCKDKNFSSPTILVDNEFIIYGGKTDSPDGACSINMPNKHELETIIKKLI